MKVYHFTPKDRVKSILKDGLKVNSQSHYSQASLSYMKDIYGLVPIFVSLTKSNPLYDHDGAILLEIEVSENDLVADIPTILSEYGASLGDDETIYWEDESDVPNKLKSVVDSDELSISIESALDYSKNALINTTRTAAITHDILPDKIKVLSNYEVESILEGNDIRTVLLNK